MEGVLDRSAHPEDLHEQRTTLLPHEVAFLLEITRREVVRMIERGELADASRDRWRRIAVEEAESLVARWVEARRCSPLSTLLLVDIASGRLSLSRQEVSWLTPAAAFGRRRAERPKSFV